MMQSQYDFLATQPVNFGCDLARGLVSWWMIYPNRFFGGSSLRDLVGTNSGTLTNGPTWTDGPNGFGAISLASGGTALVNAGSRVTQSTNRTLSMWVRPNAANTTNRSLFEIADSSATVEHCYLTFGGTGTNRLAWGFQNTIGGYRTLEWTTGWAAKTWHYVVGTYDGANLTLYSDGVQVAQQAETSTPNTGSLTTCIGNVQFLSSNRPLDGSLTDVRWFTRALPAPEVAALYDQSRRGYPNLLRRRNVVRGGFTAAPSAPGVFNAAWAQQSNILIGGGTY